MNLCRAGFGIAWGVSLALMSACTTAPVSVAGEGAPLELTILHINDHHSHLDPEQTSLQVQTTGGRRPVSVERGGFARITALMESLSAGKDNVLKLHAGDALTGDLYYTLTQGRADAALMNTVCFDVFTFGNHEFDNGDTGLVTFLTALRDGPCHTAVVSANVRPQPGTSPLTPKTANDMFTPSTVLERRGQKIGVVGITVVGKTKYASRPDPTTQFLDEATAAQTEIDHLRAQGINKIILLTHQGYVIDQHMATQLSGVDVIVGGDSHTLLGDAGLSRYGITPAGPYPTLVHDRDGKMVCVVQAWQYTQALGDLQVSFDAQGDVTRCAGTAYLPIGDVFTTPKAATALNDQDRQAIREDIAQQPALRITVPSSAAQAVLRPFSEQRAALGNSVIGQTADALCLRRMPGNSGDKTGSTLGDVCAKSDRVNAHGGDIQQLVAEAYLEQGKIFGGAEIALLNAGGVRIDLAAGDITLGKAYALLPFKNTLIRLSMTGREIVATLEDATDNALVNHSTGAYPYAAGLRWQVDTAQPKGQRFSHLEVRQNSGGYAPLDMSKTYRVIASDFIADGGDRFDTLKTITGSRRENTYLDYAEPFADYVRRHSPLHVPTEDDYSTQILRETGVTH